MAAPVIHRGGATVGTENTWAGDRAAYDLGADYMENDLRWTRDGSGMMLHDRTVDRTTNGTGYIANKTAGQVRALRTVAGLRVPYLSTVLRLAANRARGFVVELKTTLTARQAPGRHDGSPGGSRR